MNIKQAILDRTSDLRTSNSFKFYVPSLVIGSQCPKEEPDVYCRAPPPKLLPGELIVTEAHSVLLFPYATDRSKGTLGNLFVTNFRVFLSPTDSSEETEPKKQRNQLIGDYGVTLTNIDTVQQVVSPGSKGRRLLPNMAIVGRVKELQLICKNMRILTLNFEQSPLDHGNNIAKTILHHANPGRHALLFAYEYSEPITKEDSPESVTMFSEQKDWETELERTCRRKDSKWRVSAINRKFDISNKLPRWLIVPRNMVDIDLNLMACAFRSNRPPTWSWSHPTGAALVRMADCLPAITVRWVPNRDVPLMDRTQENKFLENLRGLHESKVAPVFVELDKLLPSVREIQMSFVKLRELCAPESKRQFDSQESRYHGLVENSKWLCHLASCIREASAAADNLRKGIFVVLQEGDGRDTSALVASLVQIILDAKCRTIFGFQSLIQKEWVAMGHPFCSRLGLVRDSASEQSAVFLLFLDCVWQLQRQNPTSFEFSETYLTSLFDSCFTSVFDTFIFDCEKDRLESTKQEQETLRLRSVWNWQRQFSNEDIQLFHNPLYQLEDFLDCRSPKKSLCAELSPSYSVSSMELWTQCYLRWLPQVRIHKGGEAQVDVIHRHLRREIEDVLLSLEQIKKQSTFDLLRSLNRSNYIDSLNSTILGSDKLLDDLETVDTFHPFSFSIRDNLSISYIDKSFLSDSDTQSVLNYTE